MSMSFLPSTKFSVKQPWNYYNSFKSSYSDKRQIEKIFSGKWPMRSPPDSKDRRGFCSELESAVEFESYCNGAWEPVCSGIHRLLPKSPLWTIQTKSAADLRNRFYQNWTFKLCRANLDPRWTRLEFNWVQLDPGESTSDSREHKVDSIPSVRAPESAFASPHRALMSAREDWFGLNFAVPLCNATILPNLIKLVFLNIWFVESLHETKSHFPNPYLVLPKAYILDPASHLIDTPIESIRNTITRCLGSSFLWGLGGLELALNYRGGTSFTLVCNTRDNHRGRLWLFCLVFHP